MVSRPFSKELKKGSADLLILALVEDRPRHGYEIGWLIVQKSRGAVVGTALVTVAMVACAIPARRAARIDAIVALRR